MLALIQLEPKYIKKIYIFSQGADPSPPLGTVLGNLGVNTSTFCTNFNLLTKKIPTYFQLKVTINIFENRSTSFSIELPSTGYILNLLKYEQVMKIGTKDHMQDQTISCISLRELICLAKWKFPKVPLKQAFLIIIGCARSMGLYIVKREKLETSKEKLG